MVNSEEGAGRPVMWLSDAPVDAGVWARLHAASAALGWWPLLLQGLRRDDEFRPWASGELFPQKLSDPRSHDAGALLAAWWEQYAGSDDEDEDDEEEDAAVTAPFGETWPGVAPHTQSLTSADHRAAEFADELLASDPTLRLGLVPATSGAEALRACGWQGPVNYTNDTGQIAAVVLDWERRFGARVVGVGFADLYLSVAAPPATIEDALRVAAEHFAFCPDNIWQGRYSTLAEYAAHLVGANAWSFWWD